MEKNIMYAVLVVFFIIIISITVLASVTSVNEPKLSVSSVIDKKLKLGDAFTVNVSIAGVTDLKGYEYRIKYDANVLSATSVVSSNFLSSSPYCIRRTINNTEGVIWVACMMPLGPGIGVSGSGTLETITFNVKGKGASNLDLYRTMLGYGNGTMISHSVEDGYFFNHEVK